MSARNAIAILDSMFDLFREMGSGISLGLQVREIARRLHRLKAEIHWSPDVALAANTLRSRAAHYAACHVPHGDCPRRRARNEARLDAVVTAFSELRAHLEQQLPRDP